MCDNKGMVDELDETLKDRLGRECGEPGCELLEGGDGGGEPLAGCVECGTLCGGPGGGGGGGGEAGRE
jgi:hypothetical protein